MALDPARLDELLNGWRETATDLGAQLFDLESQTSFSLIDPKAMTGESKLVAVATIAAQQRAWQLFSVLSGIVDRAARLRGGPGRIGERVREDIERLLVTASVDAPAPLDTSSGTAVSAGVTGEVDLVPAEAAEQIRELIETCRRGAQQIGSAWQQLLPQLNTAQHDLNAITIEVDPIDLM